MIIRTILAALALLFSLTASAQIKQQITSSQIATLKAACLADTVTCKPLHDAANDEARTARDTTLVQLLERLTARAAEALPAPPVVNVHPPAQQIRVESPAVHVAAPTVDVHVPPTTVNVAAPEVRVESPVQVHVPEQPAPVVHTHVQAAPAPAGVMEMRIVGMPERVTESTVERNPGTGQIVKSTQIERDQE